LLLAHGGLIPGFDFVANVAEYANGASGMTGNKNDAKYVKR
jgi:hypothetical protein